VSGSLELSILVPTYQYADYIRAAVESVLAQPYPGDVRLYLGLASSTDGTEAIARRLAAADDRVTLVHNPSGTTPAGLNRAIEAGAGQVIVRVDGHSQLGPTYIRDSVVALQRTGAANVGGRQVPIPHSPFEEAVAMATTSWLGTGGAQYRVGGADGPTDTVYLGVFQRTKLVHVGMFDESLIRNQDYELNIRLRDAGHAVWFVPELWVGYRPRSNLNELARQYFEYGTWKAEVLKRHRGSVRARQIAPPIAVGALVASALLARRDRWALIGPLGYLAVIAAEALRAGARTPRRLARAAVVFPTIHFAWSCGLVCGLARRRVGPPQRDS
jgi:glycosyltransferase involved in cell wall biosynthesis